jgi:hypothetical protein
MEADRFMITVPAHRVKQFGVEFFQASFSAKDIDRLVKFEVLGYSGAEEPPRKGKQRANRARVNWEALEKRIGESETAYQRPVIRRKIDELVNYYRDCKDAGTLPAIPGAVHLHAEGEPARPGPAPDPGGARGVARARRPAPSARAARADPGG